MDSRVRRGAAGLVGQWERLFGTGGASAGVMQPPSLPIAPSSLTRVLDESEAVKELVEEAAEELSAVNSALQNELADVEQPRAVELALEKAEAVEEKVQDASEKLASVNRALQDEVGQRQALEAQLAVVTDQEEVARHAAFHDPLTGLPNRALFEDRLEHGLMQARRHIWTLAVMFMDLDDFKQINDVHGHDAGDRVLRIIAERLKAKTRGDDTISRHGGDEFLYLLMQIDEEGNAAQIARKLLETVEAPCVLGTLKVSVRASVGIAMFPKDGDTAEALIKQADAAMYRAKREKTGFAFAQ